MKISIIVPIYNVEKYLSKCIESLINQTYKNLEIILVDDGSPDKCPEICDKYSELDERIVVIHQKNKGLSEARNQGIKKSTGDFLLFVDSDDTICLNACEELQKIVKDKKCDIICFNLKNIYENEQMKNNQAYCIEDSKNIKEMSYDEAIIDNIYRKHIRYEAGSKFYKKNLFDDISFPINMYAEDFAVFYLLLKKAKKIVYYDRNIYYYLQRSNSIMGAKNPKLYYDVYTTEKLFNKEVKKIAKLSVDQKKQNERRHFRQLVKIYSKIDKSEYKNMIEDEIITEIRNIEKNLLGIKEKILLLIFKLNKKLFVTLFNTLYKRA